MNKLMSKFVKTIGDVGNVSALMLLLIYIFVLLGMQIFANRLSFDELGFPIPIGADGWKESEVPRSNFDSFLWSFVTIFQVLTGEDWNAVLYDCWRAAGPVAWLYFFFLLVIGMFVVLNLFLAILLSNFSGNDGDGEEKDKNTHRTAETASLAGSEKENQGQSPSQSARQLENQDGSFVVGGGNRGGGGPASDPVGDASPSPPRTPPRRGAPAFSSSGSVFSPAAVASVTASAYSTWLVRSGRRQLGAKADRGEIGPNNK